MNLQTILELIREFGPSVIMFGFGLWGIYQVWTKMQKDNDQLTRTNGDLIKQIMAALDERDYQKRKQHDEAAEYRRSITPKLHKLVAEMQKETNADHVAIYDYCNGTSSYAGIPYLHFKLISDRRMSMSIKSVFDKVEINTLGLFLTDLEKQKTITIKNILKEEDQYPELGCYMRLNKQFKGIFANLIGVEHTLGFISITFGHNKKIDYPHIEKVVYEYAQKISHLLDYQNINS